MLMNVTLAGANAGRPKAGLKWAGERVGVGQTHGTDSRDGRVGAGGTCRCQKVSALVSTWERLQGPGKGEGGQGGKFKRE